MTTATFHRKHGGQQWDDIKGDAVFANGYTGNDAANGEALIDAANEPPHPRPNITAQN